MAIKFGMTVADMIMQLTKGFMKATGRKPDGLEKIKIQQEANQRFKDMNKVVDMEGKTIDTSKGIMGGKQAKAMGGRIGFGGGSDMGTVGDSKGNVGPGKGGYQGGGDGKGGKAGGPGDGPDDKGTAQQNMVQNMVKAGMTPSQINRATRSSAFNLGKTILGNVVTGGAYSLLDPNVKRAISAIRGVGALKDIYGNPTATQFGLGNLFGGTEDEEESESKKDDLTGMAENVRNMDQVMDRQAQIEARAKELGFADGGRIGFKKGMDRRTFMKIMGGLTTLPILGKFFKGAEVAAPVAEKAVQAAKSIPPYFFRLVEKIRFMGEETLASQDKAIAKKYKDYVMEEDFAGNIEIIKRGEDLQGNKLEDVYMSYKVDEVPVTGGKKGSAKVEEYEEFTARPDAEGKMKDVEPGVPDEVVEEAGDVDSMTLKRAGGGIARMLGE